MFEGVILELREKKELNIEQLVQKETGRCCNETTKREA